MVSVLHVTFLEPQEICVCIRSQFGLQPIRPLRSCKLFPIDNDTPLLASLFGSSKSKPSTRKPAGKRRASPLKDPPIQSDEDDESSASDYIMGETKDGKKPKYDRQEEEDVPMEQADYDRDSDSDEDKKPSEPSRGTAKAEGNAYAASGSNTEAYTEDQNTAIHDLGRRDGIRQCQASS